MIGFIFYIYNKIMEKFLAIKSGIDSIGEIIEQKETLGLYLSQGFSLFYELYEDKREHDILEVQAISRGVI